MIEFVDAIKAMLFGALAFLFVVWGMLIVGECKAEKKRKGKRKL